MALITSVFSIGPMANNSYLVTDPITREGVVIDPSFGSQQILDEASRLGIKIKGIWLTHAHFDHIAGVAEITKTLSSKITIGLHPSELNLYHQKGGALTFGMEIESGPEPTVFFEHGQILTIGANPIEVLHTPGHRPGHVVFYSRPEGLVFCGDLIFKNGIGRTDLDGGSYAQLVESIQSRIFTLPAETRLLPGHGPETTVGKEIEGMIIP